jgi:hypothetical protein
MVKNFNNKLRVGGLILTLKSFISKSYCPLNPPYPASPINIFFFNLIEKCLQLQYFFIPL